MSYLTECGSCLNFIPYKAVNCRICGAFQMRLNWDFFEVKMEGFQRLAEDRYELEERIDKMFGEYGLAEIEMYKAEREARRELFKEELMEQIEGNEYFLLN